MMKLPRRKFLHWAVGAAALPAVSRIARAQTYPTRPVRIVVSLPVGSTPDIVARIIAEQLTRMWGRQVIAENRLGGGGVIGAQAVLSALPVPSRFPCAWRKRSQRHQCAMKTGSVALARMWRVAPPKINSLRRLCV